MILNHKGDPATILALAEENGYRFFCLDYRLNLDHVGDLQSGQLAFDEMVQDWIQEAEQWSDKAYTKKLLNRRSGRGTYFAKFVLDMANLNKYDPSLLTGGDLREF